MTQELIANMLGVRREGVTEAAGRCRTPVDRIPPRQDHHTRSQGPGSAVLRVLPGGQVGIRSAPAVRLQIAHRTFVRPRRGLGGGGPQSFASLGATDHQHPAPRAPGARTWLLEDGPGTVAKADRDLVPVAPGVISGDCAAGCAPRDLADRGTTPAGVAGTLDRPYRFDDPALGHRAPVATAGRNGRGLGARVRLGASASSAPRAAAPRVDRVAPSGEPAYKAGIGGAIAAMPNAANNPMEIPANHGAACAGRWKCVRISISLRCALPRASLAPNPAGNSSGTARKIVRGREDAAEHAADRHGVGTVANIWAARDGPWRFRGRWCGAASNGGPARQPASARSRLRKGPDGTARRTASASIPS